jgi:hypothetical protein
VSVSSEPTAAAVKPRTSTSTRGAEDLASHQYERAAFTVRRIRLLSSAIAVPASSRQYKQAEAVVFTVPALLIQQRVLQDLQPSHSLAGLRLRESVNGVLC